jgi:hypothetical protein
MTDRPTLLTLAERCEQEAGPDRELDFAIAAGVGWPDSPNLHQHARRYTENIDAAVTLVPEGWTWARYYSGAVECGTLNGPDGSILFERGEGASFALALCAAALRARAAAYD